MGNSISYYMNSTWARQELYNDIQDKESDTNNKTSINSSSYRTTSKYYILIIYIDPTNQQLKELYINAAYKHNLIVDKYLTALSTCEPYMEDYCFNAGFDLFCPQDIKSIGSQKVMLDHKINCCMIHQGIDTTFKYVSYYLYSRSSLPLKTPLRLANNVGIIDSGYRGSIKGIFDNIYKDDFTIDFGTRLLQICPPNLEYPMKIIIVDNLDELGKTSRGEGGFGSTGTGI